MLQNELPVAKIGVDTEQNGLRKDKEERKIWKALMVMATESRSRCSWKRDDAIFDSPRACGTSRLKFKWGRVLSLRLWWFVRSLGSDPVQGQAEVNSEVPQAAISAIPGPVPPRIAHDDPRHLAVPLSDFFPKRSYSWAWRNLPAMKTRSLEMYRTFHFFEKNRDTVL